MTVTLSDETVETIIAALHQRARLYGSDTRRDREEQETIYRIIADIDLQTTSLIQRQHPSRETRHAQENHD